MKYLLLFFALLFSFANSVFSQKINTAWVGSFNSFTIGKKTSIHFDAQWRSDDDFRHMQTLLIRPGINYKATDRLLATAGYAYISNRRLFTGDADQVVTGYSPEHRIWEQLIYTHPLAKTSLAHRFRLEQRFISKTYTEGDKVVNDGNVYANRFRYFLRTVIPINGQKPFVKGVFTALQNEVMFNIGNNSHVNGRSFDQNRAYLALGYRVSKEFDIEAGYLNQYVKGRNDAFTNNHVTQLAIYCRF